MLNNIVVLKARNGARYGKSVIARYRERQPSTNQITALTPAAPAIYQSYLPDGRTHPAYIAHRTRTRTYKNAKHMQLMRRWTFDLDIELTHGQPASCWARPVNIDDGLEAIMWIRCLGGERLPTASYALRPNLNNLFLSPWRSSERSGIDIFCRLFSTHKPTTHLLDLDTEYIHE